MAIAADTTAQSLTGKNDLKKNSSVVQPSSNKKSRIREHPFMIEVGFHYSTIIILCILSFFQFITSGLSVSVANVVTLPSKII